MCSYRFIIVNGLTGSKSILQEFAMAGRLSRWEVFLIMWESDETVSTDFGENKGRVAGSF